MMTHEDAVREIICHAGSQFDPQVVAVFARWAVVASDGSARDTVEEELERLPAGLLRLDRARWG
jgi:HD-GYP domain-containing protein (c-di-GMP phosphodiesterase class II)